MRPATGVASRCCACQRPLVSSFQPRYAARPGDASDKRPICAFAPARSRDWGPAWYRGAMGETVEFDGISAYLAGGGGPGIVALHEWWGLVPHIKDVCDRFAALGFTALAPDLYHGATAANAEPDRAGTLSTGLD